MSPRKKAPTELSPAGGLPERLRRVKSPDELNAIREAARLADDIYEWTLEQGLGGRAEIEVARAAVDAAQAAGGGLLAEASAQLGAAMMQRQSPEAGEHYHRALTLFHTAGDRCGEEPLGRQRQHEEALQAEGHGARASRLDPRADLRRRRSGPSAGAA